MRFDGHFLIFLFFYFSLQAADEPAYLTVGTDVSAKYRGAFCEAKIKTVKRMVKVKVVLKGDSTSQVVQDDQVKGPLRVGSTVEVKSPEGSLSEAVISKLTDASWYTVVFDDGDEKTLRRTSLCLKGERHFAESETLDQLPLTNPEHFGTPVIGKKTNRGRRSSQAVADDEKESSSSEEEEDDLRRLNDDLLGKVACVQCGSDRVAWYLALVISPSCNDDLMVKKDQCLVRSFADSKFLQNCLGLTALPFSAGFDGAVHFLKTKTVPDSWKMDMSEILESSSSDEEEEDDEEEEEGLDKEKEGEEKGPDNEPDPEERDHFLQQLYKFMEDRGTPINKPPVLGYKDLNLFKLFKLVHINGGCDGIESGSVWKQIYMDLGIPVLNSAASYNVKTAYRKYLYGFEEYCRSANITFRTVHYNDPLPSEAQDEPKGPTQEIKEEEEEEEEDGDDDEEEEEEESDTDRNKGPKDISPRGRRRCTLTPVKTEVKEPVVRPEKHEEKRKEEAMADEQRDKPEGDSRAEAHAKRRGRRLDESDKESEEEELEEEYEEDEDDGERSRTQERNDQENTEEDGDGNSVTGTKVKVKYGRGKTQKIYEANIKNTETDDGEVLYLVHYYGWNVRYDEWVKADRIIWPVDKGGTKRKQKKKVKNKEDGEKEEDKQPKGPGKRGRPPLKSTPPSASRSVSKTPSSEGRSGSRTSRPSDPTGLPNGEGTPRRRTRRTSGMYDSDRGSNDSGNSSEESESEDSSEKKPDWVEQTDAIPDQKEEDKEECDQPVEKVEASVAAQADPNPPNSPQENPNILETEECIKPEEEEPPTMTITMTTVPMSSTQSAVTPVTTPTPSITPAHPVKKPQEAPLHFAPTARPFDTADSDTDSATEDVYPEESSNSAVTVMASEQRTPEKKVRTDHREEPAKTPSPEKRAIDSERKSDASLKVEERVAVVATFVTAAKVEEVKSEGLPLSSEAPVKVEGNVPGVVPATEHLGPSADDELMPQIGPEALVCHEVDLDDLDEKEKPTEFQPIDRVEEASRPPPPPSLSSSSSSSSLHLPLVSAVTAGPLRVTSSSPAASAPSPESHSTKSESDVTIEVDGESQEGLGENESTHGFDASASSSNSSISLQEREGKERGQKRLMDCDISSGAKKQKRNQKRSSTAGKTEKNGAGHSSDSEDLPHMDTPNKLTPVKHSSVTKTHKLSRSPGMVSPNGKESDKHKDKHGFPSPRTYKWTFQLTELDNMTSTERISFLQDKLQEIRKYYMSLKSEVASIDRRRKRLKKKEREVSHTMASTSSGSSDTGMSPSSTSPTQSTVAVECR
uniref:ARID domain-containing protein n=1 Tax=Denticeps clupeoides TaxID=299321 RepID=A0AAY4A093_9TELE